jgi:hypothetical protein
MTYQTIRSSITAFRDGYSVEVVGIFLTVNLLVSNVDHKQIILMLSLCTLMLIFCLREASSPPC